MHKKQRKQLLKRKQGLLRDIEKHKTKKTNEKGKKDTTPDYWKKEIQTKEKIVQEIEKKLDKA
jgi:hypothetical protein